MQINRLEIRIDTNNLASEKVVIKCGYKKEGTSFGASYVRGRHVDMHIYAMLREQCDKEPAPMHADFASQIDKGCVVLYQS